MVKDRPAYLTHGERARLFPVLSETSREGRSTSIFLSCLAHVREFAEELLESVGQRVGKMAKIECYTEVAFPKGPEIKGSRPDGLIVLRVGTREWRALIEAKVGTSDLELDQVSAYLEVAKANGIDAVITLSNQFAPSPSRHPLEVPGKLTSKVPLFHWSWMHVLTYADLLLTNNGVGDVDQRFVLNEMKRFLTHPSAGVKGFDSMPAEWPELVSSLSAGASVASKSVEAGEVVGAWYQLVRDISLMLSRQAGVSVEVKLNRAHAKQHEERTKADMDFLAQTQCVQAALEIPDAAAPLVIVADLRARAVAVSMKVKAPEDRKSVEARVNWLLRQIPAVEDADMLVRFHWMGRNSHTQHTLAELRKDAEKAGVGREGSQLHTLEICLVRQLGNRFAQRKNFIVDLEALVSGFYVGVGQKLKSWQASAPKIKEERSTPQSVDPAGLQILIDPFLTEAAE